jgi:hypothetical protein
MTFMAKDPSHNLDFDTKILSKFIYALNISRQHCLSYPPDHPQVTRSAEQLIDLLTKLLEFRDQLTIGIARDTLLIQGSALGQKNAVFRKLAGELFELGIAALTFSTGLSIEELLRFQFLAIRRPEELQEKGGLAEACRSLELPHLKITAIDYDSFSITEQSEAGSADAQLEQDKSESLWDRFVSGIVEGTLSPDGDLSRPNAVDPELVADYLSRRQAASSGAEALASYEETITSFLRELDVEGRSHSHRTEALDKLGNFVDGLNPELRRQFLSSTFNSLGSRDELAKDVLAHLSNDALFAALEDVNEHRLTIPPTIMNLLGKLAQHTDSSNVIAGEALSSAELGEHLRSLFREDDPDRFIPGTYQHLLHSIVSLEDIPAIENSEVTALRQELLGQQVETQVCNVILDLLRQDSGDEDNDTLRQNLMELFTYFIEIGQFDYLVELHSSLNKSAATSADGKLNELSNAFSDSGFLDEVLMTLSVWDKSQFEKITELIRKVGPLFINPILNRLAVEKRMSLRRYYIERLLEMRDAVREPVMLRLRDSRWYVVRNLIGLLRQLNDPVVLYAVRSLLRHPHPQVQLEVYKTLKQFHDPEANQYLVMELSSGDRQRQWQAIKQIEKPTSPELRDALIQLLELKDLSRDGFDLKTRAVAELALIGDPAALPGLEQLLQSRSLLHSGNLGRLKKTIVTSLRHYPKKETQEILDLLIANGGELGELAEQLREQNKKGRS